MHRTVQGSESYEGGYHAEGIISWPQTASPIRNEEVWGKFLKGKTPELKTP